MALQPCWPSRYLHARAVNEWREWMSTAADNVMTDTMTACAMQIKLIRPNQTLSGSDLHVKLTTPAAYYRSIGKLTHRHTASDGPLRIRKKMCHDQLQPLVSPSTSDASHPIPAAISLRKGVSFTAKALRLVTWECERRRRLCDGPFDTLCAVITCSIFIWMD